jgi:DNA-binding response OmpR family regulator
MAKILLVEDDLDLRGRVEKWLAAERHSVETCDNGRDAMDLLYSQKYDLIILDWVLPELHGVEVCRLYRGKGGETPVLMLTGRGSVTEKEMGLDAGADDYLLKPFDPRELSARIRALLRRPRELLSEELEIGDMVIDTKKCKVTKNGAEVALLPLEFSLLAFFAKHPGVVFSAETLLARVWPVNSDASTEAVRTCIKTLRRKIDDAGKSSSIRTVYGVGYEFMAAGDKAVEAGGRQPD